MNPLFSTKRVLKYWSSRCGLLAVTTLAVGMLPVEAMASSISITTVANAAISPGFFDQDTVNSALAPNSNVSIVSSAGGDFNTQFLTSSLGVDSTAFAQVINGTLRMGMNLNTSGDTNVTDNRATAQFTGIAQAGVSIGDQLAVVGGPAAGLLSLNFGVSGVLSSATSLGAGGPAGNGSAATATLNANGHLLTKAFGLNDDALFSISFPDNWTVQIPYANSTAGLSLNLSSQVFSHLACGIGACSVDASSALGNTFILNNIIVLNSLGDVVPGAYAVGDSGITYANAAIPAAVPEPSTVLLLGTGGLGLIAMLRSRRKQQQAQS